MRSQKIKFGDFHLKRHRKNCLCNTCKPQRTALPKGTRRLTVGCRWKSTGAMQEPIITLKGEWLRNAGFNSGDEITVTIKNKQITIDFEEAFKGIPY